MSPYTEQLYEVLREGKELVENTIAHVSHGGPTRADAEAWLEKAKAALAEPNIPTNGERAVEIWRKRNERAK